MITNKVTFTTMGTRVSRSRGYTLIEVLVAAFILAAGVAAAAILSMTMISQQEASARIIRAINYQEQAVRLYQLGVGPAAITNDILPDEPAVEDIDAVENNAVLNNIGTVQVAVWTMTYDGGSILTATTPTLTNEMVAVRPSIR